MSHRPAGIFWPEHGIRKAVCSRISLSKLTSCRAGLRVCEFLCQFASSDCTKMQQLDTHRKIEASATGESGRSLAEGSEIGLSGGVGNDSVDDASGQIQSALPAANRNGRYAEFSSDSGLRYALPSQVRDFLFFLKAERRAFSPDGGRCERASGSESFFGGRRPKGAGGFAPFAL
jgi:hypothetical protein